MGVVKVASHCQVHISVLTVLTLPAGVQMRLLGGSLLASQLPEMECRWAARSTDTKAAAIATLKMTQMHRSLHAVDLQPGADGSIVIVFPAIATALVQTLSAMIDPDLVCKRGMVTKGVFGCEGSLLHWITPCERIGCGDVGGLFVCTPPSPATTAVETVLPACTPCARKVDSNSVQVHAILAG